MDQLRIGFVGCGLIAASHARGLESVPGVVIGPVFDIDPERATAFARSAGPSATTAGSLSEVVAGADAVYVCTWTAAHPEAVIAAAEAGRPVFCEKPLAVDQQTVDRMMASVTEAGVVNQVGLVLRHSPAFRRLRALTTEAGAGRLMNIVFRDDQYLPTQGLYNSTWRADPTKAGAGTLLEHSIHDLDLLRWIMGPFRSVSANIECFHGLDGIEDAATLLLVAESGATATLTSIWHDVLSRPSQRRVETFSERRVCTLSGDWNGPVSVEDGDGSLTTLEGQALVRAATEGDGLGLNPDADFVAAVRAGTPAYPDFALAVEAHRLADAAYRSAAEGGSPVSV